MFVTFTYLFSFVVDPVHLDFGHIPGFGFQIRTVHDFCKCFGISLFRRNLLLTATIQDFHLFLHPWDIGFSTNEGVFAAVHKYVKGSQSLRMYVYGECLLTSCERVIQKNTTKSFCFDTIRLDALLHKLTVLAHINTTSELHEA